MKKNKKESIIDKYLSITYKLGKLPSKRDCTNFGITEETVRYHFANFTKLKSMAILKYPELERFSTPPKLAVEDLDQYRYGIEKRVNKTENANLISDVSTLDYIAQFAEKVFKGRIISSNIKKSRKPIDRIHTLVLSDLHFGSDLKGDETGALDYGAVEEARRFASIIKSAAMYKEQYRSSTKLKILLIGDIIENQLHDPRTGATVAEQVCRAIHLLTQGIAYLATNYNTIEVECSTGNHGRNTQRHHKRAIHQKWDSLETIIYYSVKQACSKLSNVAFNIPKTPMGSYEAFGKKLAYTHGDTTLKLANPGARLDVKNLENQVNRINASLPDNQEYNVFVYGHFHTPHVVYLSNGTVLLGNGSLPPPDHFAVSLGIYETNNGQWIFESVEGYVVGDLRLLKISKEYDKDHTLDLIINPWTTL